MNTADKKGSMNWQDMKYLDETGASGTRIVNRASHLILWATLLFFTAALIWAANATIDEVTRGIGRVVPSGQVQTIQNLEGGIVSDILVRSGDTVSKDQVLLRIENTESDSSLRESRLQAAALKAKIARLTAEVNDVPFVPDESLQPYPEILANELALYRSRQAELESGLNVLRENRVQKVQEIAELTAQRAMLQDSLELAKEELDMKQPLVEKGVLPRVEALGIEKEIAALSGRIETASHSIPRARGALAELDERINERKLSFQTQALAELNDHRVTLARIEEILKTLEDRVKRTEVLSPVNGTVKEVLVNTIGGVIQPGADLIQIVPSEDTLVVEAAVSPRDIAFLHPGQKAMVKLTAYDFAIYGGLDASLEKISADTFADESGNRAYRIRLRTAENHLGGPGKPLRIIPGMAAEVDILTGERTVMDYLLKPLRRARERALRER